MAAIETILDGSHIGYSTVNSLQLNWMAESQITEYRLLIVPGGDFVQMGNSLTRGAIGGVKSSVSIRTERPQSSKGPSDKVG